MNELKAGALLSYLSIGLNNLVGLLYTPYMLHMLGQTEYGLYSLAASIVAYLTVLDLGFGNTIIRYTAKLRAENKKEEQYEMFGMFFLFYLGIGLVTLVLGLSFYFQADRLFSATLSAGDVDKVRVMIALLTLNLSLTFPLGIFGSILTAYEVFVFQKLVNLARILLNPLVMIVMLALGYRAIGMVVILSLFNLLTLVSNGWYCICKLNIKMYFRRFEWDFFKEIAVYSFWLFLYGITERIYWSSGQFILGMYKGAASVAVYAVAIQFQGIYMSFSTAISGIFLPKVTAMVISADDRRVISDLFIRVGRIQYGIMVFILVGFILFGRPFILLWAGSDYEESYRIALLFFISLLIPCVQNLGVVVLQARNQMKFRSLLYISLALFSLLLAIPLVQWYGGLGCAWSIVLALLGGQWVAMNIYYFKKVGIDIPRFWKELGKMSVVPLLVGLLVYLILRRLDLPNTVLNLILSAAVFTVIYLPLYWIWGMNAYERQLLFRPMKRFLKR